MELLENQYQVWDWMPFNLFFLVIHHSRVFFILHTHTTLFFVKFIAIIPLTLAIRESTMHSLLFFIGTYLHL